MISVPRRFPAGALLPFTALVFGATGSAGTPPLFRQQFIPAGTAPSAIASGDMNNDGRTDFMVAEESTTFARIYRALGDGRFEEAYFTSLNARPRAIAIENLKGDSNPDFGFIGTNFAVTIPVFGVQAGNGAFSFPSGDIYGLTFEPVSFVLRDLDLDGDRDVVISGATTQGQGRLVVRKNNAGSFGPEVLIANVNSRDLDCGDIDSDGFPEIVAIDGPFVRFFKNQAGSTFVPLGSILEPFTPSALTLADLTGDGKLDLATAADSFGAVVSNPIVVRAGRGDGGFDEWSRVYVPYLQIDDLIAADVDHDGDLDVTTATDGLVVECLNDGAGRFRIEGGSSLGLVRAIFDADGDLDLDLFGVDVGRGGVTMLLRDSLDGLRHFSSFDSPGAWKSATFGDADLDGRRDAVAVVDDPIVHRGLPNGGLSEVAGISVSSSGVISENAFDSVLLDVNSDGDLDLLRVDPDLRVALGQSGANFAPFGPPIILGTWQSPAVAAADFDHDGDPDLVVVATRDRPGGVLKPVRNQSGVFVGAPSIATPKPARHVAIADFNGDNHLDVAIACDDGVAGEVVVRFGDGNLGFPNSVTLPTPRVDFVAAVDWSGDGKIDVVTGGKAQVWVSNGVGGFSAGAAIAPPSDPTAELRGVRDVDGDGSLDLVYRGSRESVTGFFRTFTLLRRLTTGMVEESIATGFAAYFEDLDADGSIELLNCLPSVPGIFPGGVTVEHPATAHDPCGGAFLRYGYSCAATPGDYLPFLIPLGCPGVGGTLGLEIDYAPQNVTAVTFLGTGQASTSAGNGCSLLISGILPVSWAVNLNDSTSNVALETPITPSLAGGSFTAQTFVVPTSGIGFAASNGVKISVQ